MRKASDLYIGINNFGRLVINKRDYTQETTWQSVALEDDEAEELREYLIKDYPRIKKALC